MTKNRNPKHERHFFQDLFNKHTLEPIPVFKKDKDTIKPPIDPFYVWTCEHCLAGGSIDYLIEGKCPFCGGLVKKE